jgi:hypothetical protein
MSRLACNRPTWTFILALIAAGGWSGRATSQPAPGAASTPQLTYVEQGWKPADRQAFYTTSQGSRLIPYEWFKALRRPNSNELFGADGLKRYGYLPNEYATNNLPIGFVLDTRVQPNQMGMTCAACHTGQLEYKKENVTYALRLDGAPAHSDFQLFLTDLRDATRATSTDPQRFETFARTVLGSGYSSSKAASLERSFDKWTNQFGEFMDKSLPPSPWGPGRLDAFNMIFNRVAARDIDQPQNFAVADSPVSYPFLWNASKQDRTQWNGGVENGLFIHGLARNTGEVLGVFGEFTPKRITLPSGRPFVLYRDNSADFAGLQKLEEKIAALKPPPWPFDLEPKLAEDGEKLFKEHCSSCHAPVDSKLLPNGIAWNTAVQAVGTDPKMANNAANRMADTGRLAGELMPRPLGAHLESRGKTTDVLAVSVIGILRGGLLNPAVQRAIVLDLRKLPHRDPDRVKFVVEKLSGLFQKPPEAEEGAYEARVLHGVWATAPYLHNGSVPNLWELLKPPKDRMTTFKVGSRVFDQKNVGFSTDESPFEKGDLTVDPLNANGNGNAGHAYGTDLSEADRWALIEYLKKL